MLEYHPNQYRINKCNEFLWCRYVLAKMEEESEEDPHGHITSLAVRRSHRYVLEVDMKKVSFVAFSSQI